MEIIRSAREMQRWTMARRCDNKTIGFVPTMGALHEGHLALARRAQRENDVFVASVFVNPTQFAPGEDFEKYARPFERDCQLLQSCGCDVVFAPSAEEMYPASHSQLSTRNDVSHSANNVQTIVEVLQLSEVWEGAIRPGHLRGVATIVIKLFHLTNPSRAYFGEKDYQQLKVIEHMVRDLWLDVEIVPCETIRESDGLALSSRNAYLNAAQRQSATILSRALQAGIDAAKNGERDVKRLNSVIEQVCLSEPQLQIQYIAIVNSETLEPLETLNEHPARVLIAAKIGTTRLIDNMAIYYNEPGA